MDVPARGFAEALVGRYKRSVPWRPPLARVWRRAPVPAVVAARVSVIGPVTRLTRIVEHTADRLAPVVVRAHGAAPATARLSARQDRVETVVVRRSVTVADGTGAAATPGTTRPAIIQVPPAPRVFTRPPTAAVAPVQAPLPGAHAIGPDPRPAPRVRPADATPVGIDMIDVHRLTDRVVDAIDRRLLAYRERVQG